MSRIEDNRDPGYEPRSVVITYTVTIDATIADCDDEDDTVRDMRATLAHATRALPGCNEISIEVEGSSPIVARLLSACEEALCCIASFHDSEMCRDDAVKVLRAAIAKAKGGAR